MLGGWVWKAGPNLEAIAVASEAALAASDRLRRTRWCREENWLCRLRLKALTPNIPRPTKSSGTKASKRTRRETNDNHTTFIQPKRKAEFGFIFISILFGFFVWWQLQMSALFNHYVANLWGSPISFRRYHYGWDALSFWLYRENRTEEKGEKKKHLKKSQSDHNFYGLTGY